MCMCHFREHWASAKQTPEAKSRTHRSADYICSFNCGVRRYHQYIMQVELVTAIGLVSPQHNPGPQFTSTLAIR